MKTIKKLSNILCVAALSLAGTSCGKEYLDKEPSAYVTPEQLARANRWSADILLGQNAGTVRTAFAAGQASGTQGDFGQKASDIQMDLLSSDMEMSADTYGHFRTVAQYLSWERSQVHYSYVNWRIYYKVVFTANGLIDIVGTDELSKLPADITATTKYYWGQSKVLRAYAYFYLAQFYADTYENAQNTPVLPIYRSASVSTPATKSTLADVYAQIITDLTEGRQAIQESGVARGNKSEIDVDVASAYLAYAHLQKGDYANAHTEAKRVIDGGKYRLLSAAQLTTDGFNSVNNPEFIWAIDITKDNTTNLASFWGHVDKYTYGYGSEMPKLINQTLHASIPATDLRGAWFDAEGYPSGKFFSGDNPRKVIDGDRTWLSDIHFMRLADMYLVGMEAAARKGDATEAKRLLKELMAQRTDASNISAVNTEIDGLNDADLLERIRYNWRVELWGEGRSLMTMKRFKAEITRTPRSQFFSGQTIRYNDKRLVYEYPEREISNNFNF